MKTKYFLTAATVTILHISPLFCRLSGPEIGSLRRQFNSEFLQPWKQQKIISDASLSQANRAVTLKNL